MNPNPRLFTLGLILAGFMPALDIYITTIALPAIAVSMGEPAGSVAWVTLVYSLAQASALLVSGRIGDAVGHKKVFVSGLVLFTLSSLLCGLATVLPVLIAARAVQGLGAAMSAVSGFALVTLHLPEEQRGEAFGILSAAIAAGMTLGAPAGGLLTGLLSWHWIFFINLPVGAGAIAAAVKSIPPDPPCPPFRIRNADPAGAVGTLVSILSLLLLLQRGKVFGWRSNETLALALVFIVSSVVTVVLERRHVTPLLRFDLLVRPQLVAGLVSVSAAYGMLAGVTFLLPFFFLYVPELSMQAAGLLMSCFTVPLMLLGPPAGKGSSRYGARPFAAGGMAIVALASLFFARMLPAPGVSISVAYMIALGVGVGLFNSPTANHVMAQSAGGVQGAVSGLYQTVLRLSSVVGICVFEVAVASFLPAGIVLGKGTPDAPSLLPAFQKAFLLAAALSGVAVLSSLSFVRAGVRADLVPEK